MFTMRVCSMHATTLNEAASDASSDAATTASDALRHVNVPIDANEDELVRAWVSLVVTTGGGSVNLWNYLAMKHGDGKKFIATVAVSCKDRGDVTLPPILVNLASLQYVNESCAPPLSVLAEMVRTFARAFPEDAIFSDDLMIALMGAGYVQPEVALDDTDMDESDVVEAVTPPVDEDSVPMKNTCIAALLQERLALIDQRNMLQAQVDETADALASHGELKADMECALQIAAEYRGELEEERVTRSRALQSLAATATRCAQAEKRLDVVNNAFSVLERRCTKLEGRLARKKRKDQKRREKKRKDQKRQDQKRKRREEAPAAAESADESEDDVYRQQKRRRSRWA